MNMTTTTTTAAPSLQQPHLATLAAVAAGTTVEGIYRIASVTPLAKEAWSATLLRLRDASGAYACLATPDVMPKVASLGYRAVKVRFTTSHHPKFGLQGQLASIEVIDEVPDDLVLDLLPRPKHITGLISRMRALVEALSEPMRKFALRVLSDDDVTRALCGKPASRTYHHVEHGGLLRHGLEMAEQISRAAYLDPEQREIGLLAALFHDIGKTRTLDWRGLKTNSGEKIPHESLTLSICERGLRTLRRRHPHQADEICHIWTAAYPGQYGIPPQSPLVQIVRDADRNSVMHDKWLQKCAAEARLATAA